VISSSSQDFTRFLTNLYQLLIEQRNYSHIPTYVFKAEAALDAATAATNANNEAGAAPTSKKSHPEREKIQTKLDFATALSHLGQGNYEKAAYYFTRLGSMKDLGDWVGKVWQFSALIALKVF
jgi:COP9 signalosome complex subunit 1